MRVSVCVCVCVCVFLSVCVCPSTPNALTLAMPPIVANRSYLVVDLESDVIEEVKAQLEAMDSNVRCRLLFRGKGYVGPEV